MGTLWVNDLIIRADLIANCPADGMAQAQRFTLPRAAGGFPITRTKTRRPHENRADGVFYMT